MTVKELFEYVKEFKAEFNTFKSNDFHGLEAKTSGIEKTVNKLSIKIAWMLGGFTVLNGIVWVLVKVLG